MNLFTFESLDVTFKTEEDCEQFLMKKRWGDGFCCPKCDHHLFYKVKTRNLLECKECRTQISLTAGTVMHKSKLPLMLWFKAIRALIQEKETHTIGSFASLLNVNYRTAKLMLEKIQQALNKQFKRLSKSQGSTSKKITNFCKFIFVNSKNIKYDEEILFRKWMNAFLSVYLYPVYLRYHQLF
ncbi:transposase [Paenibacillus aceris]|uniref:DNA-directed RNA polymerase subunit RPC12/RpoP n=1 Tax=Paenibacillus aceris TaxID=869555 RepID=A0ABS4HUZ7_9BACL|nr:DNA-directed RNA polymerase subunit RPC12/RpoP [Paenibacillus aceris]NHW37257.1 transposase [Paenibacillus aceris]